MANYLEGSFKNYIDEIVSLQSRLHAIINFIGNYKGEWIAFAENNEYVQGSTTSFRDISINGVNLITLGRHRIDRDNIKDEFEILQNIASKNTVVVGFERFETFLIDILTEFYFNNPNRLVALDKTLQLTNISLPKENIRILVKNAKRVKAPKFHNEGLFNLVFLESSNLKDIFSVNNTLKFDFLYWYSVIAQARHCIVHCNGSVSEKLRKYYLAAENLEDKSIFGEKIFFWKEDNESKIYFKDLVAIDNTNLLNTMAFQIFKSLSENLNLEVSYKP